MGKVGFCRQCQQVLKQSSSKTVVFSLKVPIKTRKLHKIVIRYLLHIQVSGVYW